MLLYYFLAVMSFCLLSVSLGLIFLYKNKVKRNHNARITKIDKKQS